MLPVGRIQRLLPLHGLLKGMRVGPRHVRRYRRSLLQSDGWFRGCGSRYVKVALRRGRRGLLANGRKKVPVGHRRFGEGVVIVVAAKHGVQRLVLVGRRLLTRRVLRSLSRAHGRRDEVLVGRGYCGVGKRREVARAVAKFILDGEGCQAADAPASLFLLLESLGQQASLEGKSVQG